MFSQARASVHNLVAQSQQAASIDDFLIRPIQRIMRYRDLVERLLKYTPPGHADAAPLNAALLALGRACRHVDQPRRAVESSQLQDWCRFPLEAGVGADCDTPAPAPEPEPEARPVLGSWVVLMGPRRLE